MSINLIQARIHSIQYEASSIVRLRLRPASTNGTFPKYEPGSHIDLHLGNGLTRSYSLLKPYSGDNQYEVGVLKDKNSRGGSKFIHENLRVGDIIRISEPRNNFKLIETSDPIILVAGGIGITPIFCMLQQLLARKCDMELFYCASSRLDAAFVDEIASCVNQHFKLNLYFDNENQGPPNLAELLSKYQSTAHFYCCGPIPMLNAFERTCETLGYKNTHLERFTANISTSTTTGIGYEVELKRSEKIIKIVPGQSILDGLIENGVSVDYSCKEGVCGSCETSIVSGEVEHLDGILTKSEKAANKSMMICVSYCKGGTLVLDI